MTQKYFLRIAAFVALIGTLSVAEAFQSCYDRADNSMAIRQCQSDELTHYDTRLNRNYRRLMQKLPREEQAHLRTAQRAWIAWRDSECLFEGYPMRGGTGERMLTAGCIIKLTRKRAEGLEKLMAE